MRQLLDVYFTQFKVEFAVAFQYRAAVILRLMGMVVEPMVYLAVWVAVTRARGSMVGGYTAAGFAAYYIVWTLVHQMSFSMSAGDFEELVRGGLLSPMLLRPALPFHTYLASTLAFKALSLLFWIPGAALLMALYQPALNPSPGQVLAFVAAMLMGLIVRYLLDWTVGLTAFWTTRVSAIFQVYFAVDLFLSGRLAPISLLPEWAQRLSGSLPFRWSFAFPIEVLLGETGSHGFGAGLAIQLFWVLMGMGACALLWRRGLRRYAAVGG